MLGLARDLSLLHGDEDDSVSVRPLSFMKALVKNGLISSNVFSLFIAPSGQESFIDFGAPLISRMRDNRELQYLPANDDFFWSA